jgi:hypothetical protein
MRLQGEVSTDVGGSHSCPSIGAICAICGQMNCRFQVQPGDSVAWGHAADRNAILSILQSCLPQTGNDSGGAPLPRGRVAEKRPITKIAHGMSGVISRPKTEVSR